MDHRRDLRPGRRKCVARAKPQFVHRRWTSESLGEERLHSRKHLRQYRRGRLVVEKNAAHRILYARNLITRSANVMLEGWKAHAPAVSASLLRLSGSVKLPRGCVFWTVTCCANYSSRSVTA